MEIGKIEFGNKTPGGIPFNFNLSAPIPGDDSPLGKIITKKESAAIVLSYQIVPRVMVTMDEIQQLHELLKQAYSDDYRIVKDEQVYGVDDTVYHFLIALPVERD